MTLRPRWIILAISALAGIGAYTILRPEPNDTRHNGAYRFEDGGLAFVSARKGAQLRMRWLDGRSHVLWPAGDNQYEIGAGFAGREPAEGSVRFGPISSGDARGLIIETGAGESARAPRLELSEETFTFESGDLALRGRLVLPEGEGPFPAVVLVHGSGDESAVETYFYPYLYASHGIATLVYDKRGTGDSEGKFTQNFHVLAEDVLAAVRWLRERPDVDADAIHLAGYSQGGWIAPIAAAKDGRIRSLLIGYGPGVPVTGEDRWGYVYELQRKGFGPEAIAAADSLNVIMGAILDRGENRWAELDRRLDVVSEEAWFEAIKDSDSLLGFVASTWMPTWVMKLYYRWITRDDIPFIDRTYDPVPTIASLKAPSLWIFGGEDRSMPTGWTVDKLDSLEAEGRPIEVRMYNEADHGIILFREDETGQRQYTRYASGYFQTMADWLVQQSRPGPVEAPQRKLSSAGRSLGDEALHTDTPN